MVLRSAPALGVAFAVAAALAGCAEEAPRDLVRPVISMKVADASGFEQRTFTGRAKATAEINLAFEVPGRLIERPVKVGDAVSKGQLLARLDPRDFEARLRSAQGTYRTAKANYERAEVLVAADALPKITRDERRAVFDVTAGDLLQAEKALEDTKVVAPFDGTIAATYVENYQNVRATQQVMRLLDTSHIEMVIDIPESLISLAPHVEDIRVRFDAFPDRELPASIKEIGTEASATTRTFPVTLIMDQPDDVQVLAGMAGRASGTARVPGNLEKQGVEIPVAAIFTPPDGDGESSYVWVIEEPSLTVTRRQVESGMISPRGVRVHGLERGERIAIAGVHYLREGQQVRLSE